MRTTRKTVHYSQSQRERAKQVKQYLVTVAVDGREVKGDSVTVQRLADRKLAKQIANFALKVLTA